jgi:hypothetical protein
MQSERALALYNVVDMLHSTVNISCEQLDTLYIQLLEEEHEDRQVLRSILVHLKDARNALEKAKAAIP